MKYTKEDLWFRSALHEGDIDFTDVHFAYTSRKRIEHMKNLINRLAAFMRHGSKHPMIRVYDKDAIDMIHQKFNCFEGKYGKIGNCVTPSYRSGVLFFPYKNEWMTVMYGFRFNKYGKSFVAFKGKEYAFYFDSLYSTTRMGFRRPKDAKNLGFKMRDYIYMFMALEKYADEMCFGLLTQGKAKICQEEGFPEEDIEMRDGKWVEDIVNGRVPKDGYHMRTCIVDDTHEKKLAYKVASIYGI